MRALTQALEGSNKRHDATIKAIASLSKAVMEQTTAVSKLGEYVTDFTGQAPDVITGAKLAIDAASRTNDALVRSTERLEQTGTQLTLSREVVIAPRWTHRALDTLWPYAEHSAQRIVVLTLTSFGAGAAVLSAVKALMQWVF